MIKRMISIALGGVFCFLSGMFLFYSLRNFSTFMNEYGVPILLDTLVWILLWLLSCKFLHMQYKDFLKYSVVSSLLFSFLFATVFFFIDPFVAIYGWPQLILTMFVAICSASCIIIGSLWIIKRLGD